MTNNTPKFFDSRVYGLCVTSALLTALIIFLVLSLSKPTNPHDCILKNIQNAKTENAVAVITRTCSNLYQSQSFGTNDPPAE